MCPQRQHLAGQMPCQTCCVQHRRRLRNRDMRTGKAALRSKTRLTSYELPRIRIEQAVSSAVGHQGARRAMRTSDTSKACNGCSLTMLRPPSRPGSQLQHSTQTHPRSHCAMYTLLAMPLSNVLSAAETLLPALSPPCSRHATPPFPPCYATYGAPRFAQIESAALFDASCQRRTNPWTG